MQARQLVHAVAVQPAFEDVGDQHGVLDRGHADAAPRHDGEVVFDVLAHLQNRRVFQQGLEAFQRGGLVDLRQRLARLALGRFQTEVETAVQRRVAARLMVMGQRNIAGLVRADRDGDAAQTGMGGRQGVGLGVEADDPGGAGAGDPAVQILQRLHALVTVAVEVVDRVGRRDLGLTIARRGDRGAGLTGEGRALLLRGLAVADAAQQGTELHPLQELRQHRRVGIADQEVVDRLGRRGVAGQGHKLARQTDLVGEGDQGLAPFGLLDLARAGQQRVEVAVFVDQLGRRLRPDAGGAGDVVDAVADQGLNLDHLVGGDAELLEHGLFVQAAVLHRVVHDDAVADQLHQVLVGADDDRLAAHVADLAGIGGDQVVGLIAGQFDAVDAEGGGRLAHQGELRHQILGRRRAVGLVLIVKGVAEGLFRVVEDGDQMGRAVLALHVADQLPQHVAVALHRPDGQAVRLARQGRQGVIGAEDIGRGVDQPQPGRRSVLGEGAGGGFDGRVGHGANIGGRGGAVICASAFLPTVWGGGPRSGGGGGARSDFQARERQRARRPLRHGRRASAPHPHEMGRKEKSL
ncbi:hypothetical protein D3C86_1184550 [compost metagenome]